MTLEGEPFGRIVRRPANPEAATAWELLRMDDMTDEQLDIYEAAMAGLPRADGGAEPG